MRPIDQFLSYFISLESISRHVPGVERQAKRDKNGNVLDEMESLESAGIRHLASRHPDLPANTRQTLAKIRGSIAHGSTSPTVVLSAFSNLPVIQRLAADGIALVIGLPPEQLQFLRPSFVRDIVPLGRCKYQEDANPLKKWGKPLTQAFQEYLAKVRQQSGS